MGTFVMVEEKATGSLKQREAVLMRHRGDESILMLRVLVCMELAC